MIEITQVRNAISLQSDNLRMDVEINHPEFGWIPYTISPDDTDATINNDALKSLIGSDYAAYVAPTKDEIDAEASRNVRAERDFRLETEVDPIAGNALRWNDLTDEQRAAWTQYRMNLLNLPQQSGFPSAVNWPNKPE